MNAIVENKTFEERMKARIKDSMGDLITDEDLTTLVNQGVHDVFFKKTRIKKGYNDFEDGPALIESIVKELLEEKIRIFAQQYVALHEKEVLESVDKVAKEGAGAAILAAISGTFSSQLFQLEANIRNSFQNGGFR